MVHSKERVEAFSDAVFAFAATLIVVSFEVPESFTELQSIMKGFISFGLSFLALLLIWKIHYNFFRRIDRIDNMLIAINMILLFVILFYVYPLKFLANGIIGESRLNSFDELADLFTIYSLGFVMVFFFIFLLYRYGSKICTDEHQSELLKYWSTHFSIYFVCGILSIILAQLKIGLAAGIPGVIYFLIGPMTYWHGVKFGIPQKDSNS